jgi:two-component system, NtrC family, response regulator PilR
MASVLVVDDEQSMREFLGILLEKAGHEVATEPGAAAALERFSGGEFDLVITDLRLGRDSGIEVLKGVKALSPATEVIVVTAFATTENAVQAMKLGAYDYVLKPFKVDELQLVIAKALERRTLVAENRTLRTRAGQLRAAVDELLGRSPAIAEVRRLVAKVAQTRSTVLVTGESGTGKEVVARAIHAASGWRDRPFVAVNCGAIPEGLIESELFGHEKGSFTGAVDTRPGLFEVAGSGTLFLDEVGELPHATQVRLLRALQERRVRRVGGSGDISIGARILAATNRDLAQEVRAGRFREDLYYRLNVIQLRMPALRERREDIPVFLDHMLARFAVELGRSNPRLSPEAERLLCDYHYPGNIRELANVVERAMTLAEGDVVGVDVLPPALRAKQPHIEAAAACTELPAGGMDLQAHLDLVERSLLEQALVKAGGVKTEAARMLSLTFRSLRYRLAKYGIGGES